MTSCAMRREFISRGALLTTQNHPQCRGYERRELLSVPSTCQCISTQKYLSWRVLFLNVEISGFMTIWLSVKLLHILMALKYKKNISVTFKIDTVL